MSESIVYLNGQFVPASQAHLAIYDAGVVMAATVTEMLRTFHRRLFLLEEHLDRLWDSLRYARIEPPLPREFLARALTRLVDVNGDMLHPGEELALACFVTAGELAAYAGHPVRPGPTYCAHTFPLDFSRWAKKLRDGVHLIVSPIRQIPPECFDPKMKTRSRMHYYLADKAARDIDPEALQLLLDGDGNIAESSAANVLLVRDGVLLSPKSTHVLQGISLGFIRDLAVELDIGFEERNLQLPDLHRADEILLTSTPYCLLPVSRVDGQCLNLKAPGPIYERLAQAWSTAMKLDIRAQIRLAAMR